MGTTEIMHQALRGVALKEGVGFIGSYGVIEAD